MSTQNWRYGNPFKEPDRFRRFLLASGAAVESEMKAQTALAPEVKFTPCAVTANGEGTFEGLVAVYNVTDLQSDFIAPGAFASSLAERRKVPILLNHNRDEILGVAELSDAREGLRVHGKLNLAVARAREIYELLKQGALRGLSFGYHTAVASARGSVRVLKDVRLYEVSLTPTPANPGALVSSVKGTDPAVEFAGLLRRIRTELKSYGRVTRTAREYADAEGESSAQRR